MSTDRIAPLRPRRCAVLIDVLKQLNLFKSQSTDEHVIRLQRLSTWVYLILLSIAMLTLIVYATFSPRTNQLKIFQPSEDQFKEFYKKYPDTLQCPCSQFAIQYSDFTHLRVKLHEVCESQFIEQDWIDSVYHANISSIPPNDIRTIMSHFWQFIRSFCALSKDTLTDACTDFNATLLLSPVTQSEGFIKTAINASLNFSLTSATSNLKRNVFMTRETTLANGLMSSLATNYYFQSVYKFGVGSLPSSLTNVQLFDDGCSCSTLTGCPQPAALFNLTTRVIRITIPGMIFDCLMLDAVLASSLECFYQSACLSLLENETVIQMKVKPLQDPSQFSPTATIEQLLTTLMIEQLTTTIDFSNYYVKCNPTFCTFSHTSSFNVLFMITTVISVFGGVSLLLRFVSPMIIKLIFKIYAWKRQPKPVSNENNQQFTHRSLRNFLSRTFGIEASNENVCHGIGDFFPGNCDVSKNVQDTSIE